MSQRTVEGTRPGTLPGSKLRPGPLFARILYLSTEQASKSWAGFVALEQISEPFLSCFTRIRASGRSSSSGSFGLITRSGVCSWCMPSSARLWSTRMKDIQMQCHYTARSSSSRSDSLFDAGHRESPSTGDLDVAAHGEQALHDSERSKSPGRAGQSQLEILRVHMIASDPTMIPWSEGALTGCAGPGAGFLVSRGSGCGIRERSLIKLCDLKYLPNAGSAYPAALQLRWSTWAYRMRF